MKIAFIANSHPPKVCGVGDYTFLLAQGLTKRGYEANIFKFNKLIYRNIKEAKPDLVNIQYTPTLYIKHGLAVSVFIFALWLKARGIRCITTFHERYYRLSLNPRIFLMSLMHRISYSLMLIASESIIFCTQNWVSSYRRCFFWLRKKAYYIPVGSNIPYLKLTKEERALKRSGIGADENTLIIGTFNKVNRLRDFKNNFYFNMLLSSLETVKATGHDVKLLLIGWPKNTIGRGVVSTGQLPPAQVSEYLNLIDIYLAPLNAGLTARKGAVMAAMQHGLPVISTVTDQTDDIFKSCEAIKLIKPEKQIFINTLIDLAGDREKCRDMAILAMGFYEKNFSWDVIGGQFIKIIA